MLIKIRDNIYLGDSQTKIGELKKEKITVVEEACHEDLKLQFPSDVVTFKIGLFNDQINKPYVKDIACHIPKYMIQNGEKVAVISKTGLIRAAFVVARAICELESKSIYDVLVEMQELMPKKFDIGKAYL